MWKEFRVAGFGLRVEKKAERRKRKMENGKGH